MPSVLPHTSSPSPCFWSRGGADTTSGSSESTHETAAKVMSVSEKFETWFASFLLPVNFQDLKMPVLVLAPFLSIQKAALLILSPVSSLLIISE